MKTETWLAHTNVGDITKWKKAYESDEKTIDVTGKTSAYGPNSKQILFIPNQFEKLLREFIQTQIPKNDIFDINCLQNLECSTAWSVTGKEHSYHRLHRHGPTGEEHRRFENCIATVLFLQVPKRKPYGDFYCLVERNDDTQVQVIEPKVGDLLIFPWTLFHGVYPQGPGTRQTINVDFK